VTPFRATVMTLRVKNSALRPAVSAMLTYYRGKVLSRLG